MDEVASLKRMGRWRTLRKIQDTLETPMLVLGLVWLGLLILEFAIGPRPYLDTATHLIWGVFIVDFVVKLAIAPRKLVYLRKNWLTLLSLAVPALRVFRLLRITRLVRLARVGKSLRLLRVISSFNRGMKSLQRGLGKRGFGYVAALTVVVVLLGAAGMLAFEKDVADPAGIHDYGTAVWWTAMLVTTMGSQYWPQTTEGRVLTLLLATYAFAVFGYITATIASFFVAKEPSPPADLSSILEQLESLRSEVRKIQPASPPSATRE